MKQAGEKIAALTAYDAAFAAAVAAAGADFILVGDSLGMVVQGKKDTLGVRLNEVVYHIRCVVAGAPAAFVVGDMPFGSFQATPEQAFAAAVKLMAAGAAMVKIEGGAEMAETVRFLTMRGVPVCAHIGLLPQQVRASGGYVVQGRDDENADRLRKEALSMQAAGAALIVLELMPRVLARDISVAVAVPTIGIGSGGDCDGQILVLPDILGLTGGNKRFVRNFMQDDNSIQGAIGDYVRAVKTGDFPQEENAF